MSSQDGQYPNDSMNDDDSLEKFLDFVISYDPLSRRPIRIKDVLDEIATIEENLETLGERPIDTPYNREEVMNLYRIYQDMKTLRIRKIQESLPGPDEESLEEWVAHYMEGVQL